MAFIGNTVELDAGTYNKGRRGTIIETKGERARVHWTVSAPGEWGFKPVRTWVAVDSLREILSLRAQPLDQSPVVNEFAP